uniref:KIB1-4 beta-propeller domain-containing protein n=1 Tax=Oryza meridionalis TaxID=40149 RepID=A0A0E0EEX5_9ORYZ
MDPENVDIVAATLSRAPVEQGCIVAGIINSFLSHHQIAFWHMGDRLTDRVFSEAEQTVWLSPLEQVENLLYLDEDFLFLTKEEHIHVCPELTIFHESPERIMWRFQPRRRRDDEEEEEQVLARYLMESRGSLLMLASSEFADVGGPGDGGRPVAGGHGCGAALAPAAASSTAPTTSSPPALACPREEM